MQLKIADVSEFYAPEGGGVKTYVDQKFVAADRHGHHLTVLAPGATYRVEPRRGGQIIWVPAHQLLVDPRYYMWAEGRGIRAVLNDLQPDVVEASSPWRGGWIASRWQAASARPVVKTFIMHADPVAVYPQRWLESVLSPGGVDRTCSWFWRYLKSLSALCDASVVAGKWFADRVAAQGLRNPQVVPLGVETSLFSPKRADSALRTAMLAACNLPSSAVLLIVLGRLHGEKRLPMLIDAVARANQTRAVGLFVIGDGMARKAVAAAARRVPQAHLAGAISDRAEVAARLASADGLLHGSSSETFGYVVAEALCSGLPIIVPDRGGAADFARPDHAETYVSGDSASAAKAILRFAAGSQATMRAAAAAMARSHVSSPETHFEALFTLYQGLVAARQAAAGSAKPLANLPRDRPYSRPQTARQPASY